MVHGTWYMVHGTTVKDLFVSLELLYMVTPGTSEVHPQLL